MKLIIKCVILSSFLGTGCKLFFETLLHRRPQRFPWLNHTLLPSFTIGFLIIAFTPIPPYLLQPVRFVFVVTLIALFYFQTGVVRCTVLSTLLCSIYWIITVLLASILYLFPSFAREPFISLTNYLTDSLFLCLMLIFRYRFKHRLPDNHKNTAVWDTVAHRQERTNSRWTLLSFFPLFSILTLISIIMMTESGAAQKSYALPAAVAAFAALNICFFYFICNTLEKEEELQHLRLVHEQSQNQVNLYRSIQKSYQLQRRQLHDYKNQLDCIQGMLQENRPDKALSYLSKLTGSLAQSTNSINTNHDVVNIMLNKKYQEAREKKITMTFVVNDLSALTINEEEIVILLGNLLDNAIAACEKLDDNKIIQFKMILENEQLILSVRNPVREKVPIKENRVILKKDVTSLHGIGLLNVNSVVQRHGGTSILTCDNEWFYFSAMIP